MDDVESLDEIPNLSGQVTLWSVRPVFNGAYSSVFHGEFDDQPVAVKVLKEIYGADVRTMQRKLKRERTTWGRLRHPNVLPLLGFADDNELFQPYGALVSPWRAEGNACEFLKSRGNEISIFKRVNMWKGVVAGVAYLHNHTPVLIHGDLKSANVLIDNNHEPQICDFGLVSIFLEEGSSGMTTTSEHTGTDRYLAYELVRGGETAAPTTASDMFALGCIGLEFCFLQQPYAHRKNNRRGQIFIDIRAGVPPATLPAPSGPWNDALWAALDRCWEGHPSDRIGVRDLQARLEEALSQCPAPETEPAIGAARYTQLSQPLQNDWQHDRFYDVIAAFRYIDSVSSRFHDHPESYNRFLGIMQDYKWLVISFHTLNTRVTQLFLLHPDLLIGLDQFLRVGYRVEPTLRGILVNMVEGITRVQSLPIPKLTPPHPIPSGPSFNPLPGPEFRLP